MTEQELRELFEEHHNEYLKFDRVNNKKHSRPDLHAFLLLDELVPNLGDMIVGAIQDEIYLEPELSDLAPVISTEEAVDLIRCGVRISDDGYHLCMFV